MNQLVATKPSIAVLPFRNISNDQEMDFFSDGITEEIILALAKIEGLKVISRTSSFHFKEQQVSIKEIGQQLDVSLILEGSVRVGGNGLRISAQLIQVDEDTHLWSDTWNRALKDLFNIQDEVSLLIADKIREHTGHLFIADHLVKNLTDDLDAYKHYLKGRFHVNKWNPEDTNIAIKEFEKAVALDNQMIEAHVGIADSYSFMAVAGFAPRDIAWAKAVKALEDAKKIDANNASLNYMLAHHAFFIKADYIAAKQFALKALYSAPTHENSQRFMAFIYSLNGEFQKAEQHIYFAKSIDPLNPETAFFEAFFYYQKGEYQLAADIMDKLLAANSMNLPAIVTGLYIKFKEEKWLEAEKQILATPKALFTPDERLGMLCIVEISKGDTDTNLLVELETKAEDPAAHHAHSYLFMVYCILKKYDKAYKVLNNLFEHKSSILLLTFSNPLCDGLKKTPQYQTYFQKVYPSTKDQVKPKQKSSKPSVADDPTTQKDLDKLKTFMKIEKPFLNPMLSLRILANNMSIHPNQLSWLLNQVVGKNFNEFINQQRIEHFKKLVVDPSNSHISLIGLAYESGFNSKTVFNTAFKKEVGMTPKEYQKSAQIKE